MTVASDERTPGAHETLATVCSGPLFDDADDLSSLVGEVRRDYVASIRRYVRTLSNATKWDREQVLVQLGCEVRSRQDLDALTVIQLNRCYKFLAFLVDDVVGKLDLTADRRRAVLHVRQLFEIAAGEAKASRPPEAGDDYRLEHLTSTLQDESTGIPILEYFWLGEVEQAALICKTRFESEQQVQGATDSLKPFMIGDGTHVSPARLEALAVREDVKSALGLTVASTMARHTAECPVCMSEYEHRGGARAKLALMAQRGPRTSILQ